MNPTALLIGLAGGAAAALLFAAVPTGGAIGLPLFLFSSLPIAIASLGWGTLAGLVAAVSGAAALALLAAPAVGLLFALLAGPMAIYAHLVGLARPVDAADQAAGLEWYPLQRVFLALTVGSVLTAVVTVLVIGFDVDAMASVMTDMLQQMASETGDAALPPREQLMDVARVYASLMPATFAILWLTISSFNLWLGTRVVKISGRLRRPWTPVYAGMRLPTWMVAVFVAALLLEFVATPLALLAGAVAGGTGIAFAMVGFAVVHQRLVGHPARSMILAALYGVTVIVTIPLIPIALIGMADAAFGVRGKSTGGTPT